MTRTLCPVFRSRMRYSPGQDGAILRMRALAAIRLSAAPRHSTRPPGSILKMSKEGAMAVDLPFLKQLLYQFLFDLVCLIQDSGVLAAGIRDLGIALLSDCPGHKRGHGTGALKCRRACRDRLIWDRLATLSSEMIHLMLPTADHSKLRRMTPESGALATKARLFLLTPLS